MKNIFFLNYHTVRYIPSAKSTAGSTMVMEVNCSVSVAVVVQWQKKMYSSKTLELPKSKIVEENISATVAILQWP